MTKDRLSDLHADHAIWGLDEHEETELIMTLKSRGIGYDTSWERAAAIATVVLLEEASVEQAPAGLLAKLQADADRHSRQGVSRP